jgi:hypothetical protein
LVGNAEFLADLRAAADARTVHELIERAEKGLRESG